MKKTVIDMTSDPRRAQFALFRGYRVPYVGVSAEVDVTRLRANELPFFLTLLHCAIGAANAVLSADLALSGVESLIPFDEVVAAMKNVGRAMSPDLRETARGGVAASPTAKALQKTLFGREE